MQPVQLSLMREQGSVPTPVLAATLPQSLLDQATEMPGRLIANAAAATGEEDSHE